VKIRRHFRASDLSKHACDQETWLNFLFGDPTTLPLSISTFAPLVIENVGYTST